MSGGPRGRGARPPPSWTGGGPPDVDSSSSIFYIFQNNSPLIFRSFRELLFLHKNNTMAILLKTRSVRVSSIQIMQVRVQNKGKSVWKSRYDGDVSVLYSGFDLMVLDPSDRKGTDTYVSVLLRITRWGSIFT